MQVVSWMARETLKCDFNDGRLQHHVSIHYINLTKITVDQRLDPSPGTGGEV